MLPRLPGVVPMKAKLGQYARHGRRLLVRKLNPNPLANHFGEFKEIRRFAPEQCQQSFSFKSAICPAQFHIDFWSVSRAQLFGTAQEL